MTSVQARRLLFALGLAVYAGAAGALLAVEHARVAGILVVAVLGLSALAVNSQILSVVAVPAVFLVQRLEVGGLDLSYSDALLIVATAVALPALSRSPLPPRARLLLVGLSVYLGLVTCTVLFHPDLRSLAEIFHRAVLVGGCVVIGVLLAKSGRHVVALRLLLLATLAVSLAAMSTTLTNGLAPAYPWGLHKNFVGSLFATFLLVTTIDFRVFRIAPVVKVPVMLVLAGGLLAAQSRGGYLTLLGGYLVLVLRQRSTHKIALRAVALTAVAGIAALIVVSVQQQLQERRPNEYAHDSLAVRERVETATYELWRDNWLVGVGLKYFNSGEFGAANQAPNNVLNESMAETGIVGTVGFLVLQGVALVALARGSTPLATAALACVFGRLLHGQVDIYWSTGTAALPWLVAGMGLADVRRPGSHVDDGRVIARV